MRIIVRDASRIGNVGGSLWKGCIHCHCKDHRTICAAIQISNSICVLVRDSDLLPAWIALTTIKSRVCWDRFCDYDTSGIGIALIGIAEGVLEHGSRLGQTGAGFREC